MLHFETIFLSVSLLLLPVLLPTNAIRSFPDKPGAQKIEASGTVQYNEAPEYRNGPECPALDPHRGHANPSRTHLAMTLDSNYLRGSLAAVHSILKHTSCPENIFFHFISSSPDQFTALVQSTFPYLNFRIYPFHGSLVKDLISPSIRKALEDPLNYARTYLANILDSSVQRVIYLDSDIIVVDDVRKLWSISLSGSRVIGAPVYCHVNFTKYFTNRFWVDPDYKNLFDGKNPCYFNTGVMVMDLKRWREGDYRKRIEKWMEIQREKRIYQLGSLPPFLLVFAGEVEEIDHRWNQHGLGGENMVRTCRSLHPGPVSLLHWSGRGKPWVRLDEGDPCPVDSLWAPYDLFRPSRGFLLQDPTSGFSYQEQRG